MNSVCQLVSQSAGLLKNLSVRNDPSDGQTRDTPYYTVADLQPKYLHYLSILFISETKATTLGEAEVL